MTSLQEWREHCERLAEHWGIDLTRHEVRIFKNLHQAVNEAMLGLRRLYSFKKKVYFFPDQIPHTEVPLKSLAKEGVLLETLHPETFKDPADFLAKIEKESHFVIYAVDDPVLATVEDVDALETQLADKPILKVRVSFHRHFHDGLPAMDRNTVHILGMPDGSAVALLGERVRFAPQGVELLDWSVFNWREFQKKLDSVQERQDQKKSVQDFESRTDLGFRPLLPVSSQRTYDRALIVWDDLDSYAMLESLCETDGHKCAPCGKLEKFESLSLSRWGGTKGFQWLEAKGFSKDVLRGALVIDAGAINDDLVKAIRSSRQRILEAQSGDQ